MSRVDLDGSNRCGRFKLGMGLCFVSARHLPVAGALLSVRRASPGAVKVPCCRCKVARAASSLLAVLSEQVGKLFDLAGTSCKRPASLRPAK